MNENEKTFVIMCAFIVFLGAVSVAWAYLDTNRDELRHRVRRLMHTIGIL